VVVRLLRTRSSATQPPSRSSVLPTCDPAPRPPTPPVCTTASFHPSPQHLTPPSLQSGAERATNLKVLYLSNNKIASWNEIDKLASLAHLEDLLLVGNPLYNEYKENNALAEYRVEVRVCMRACVHACVQVCTSPCARAHAHVPMQR